MNVNEIVEVVKSVNKFADTIKTGETKFSDVKALSKIDESINDSLNFLMSWVVNEPVTTVIETTPDEDEEPWREFDPDAEWVRNNIDGIVVSNSGLFWSLDQNKLITPRFVGGDLRVDFPNGDAKRAAVIVAKTFRLWSADRNSTENIIWYKDGDHRNIALSNLVWKNKSECLNNNSAWSLLVEDICRRIIEHNCDIDAILARYQGSDPPVDKILLKRIIRKEKYSDISDRFFILSGDTIVPREDIITQEDAGPIAHTSIGYDVASFLVTTGDKVLSRQLLIDKIKENQLLSEDEKTMMVFSAIESIGGKKTPSSRLIGNKINEIYNATMPFDVIDHIVTNGSRSIADLYI